MIIAVGFKVNNDHAVQFRKWAGQIVKDYTIQGWVIDVDRLKKGHMFTDEYFERQLQTGGGTSKYGDKDRKNLFAVASSRYVTNCRARKSAINSPTNNLSP